VKTLYTAVATATDQGRGGSARSDDGRLDVQLSSPKAMGGDDGPGTNPEQLFAAGYAACFSSALGGSAAREGDASVVEGSTVTAHVGIGPLGKGRFGLEVRLEVKLPKLEQDKAEALVAVAHERCPYSNATRGNVEVTLDVTGA